MNLHLFILLLFLPFLSHPQGVGKRVEIAGKFIHSHPFQDRMYLLSWTVPSGIAYMDTIYLKEDDSFHLQTYKITGPVLATINYQNNRTLGPRLLLAPGDSLQLSIDMLDLKNVQVGGKRKAANSYFLLIEKALADSLFVQKYRKPAMLAQADFEDYIHRRRQLSDAIRKQVFAKSIDDAYEQDFEHMLYLETQYELMALVHDQAWYTSKAPQAMIDRILGRAWKKELNQAANLISPRFRNFLQYLPRYTYWATNNYRVSPDSIPALYRYEFAMKNYSGKVRDYLLGMYLWRDMTKSHAAKEDFTQMMATLQVYRQVIVDQKLLAYLDTTQAARYEELEKEQTALKNGDQAPAFSLKDINGKSYTLAEFKGKILYIDLWASWCGPCKEQIPHLARLYQQYKASDVVFISIALWDRYAAWQKTLQKDQPGWLQLFDATDMVAKAYGIQAIPHFMLIDKQGKILQQKAPKPSDTMQIKTIHDQQTGR
ncbi:TlpA disulfide reductase family protein [Rhodocytophaga aerolata]|uniref:TlpA disulfide reductase family protein n=1 Tax=Rhodocytophaga aerolata TaxID=455078 RepID=A0ABT8RBC4_9BACT|nr:TlpA disulfide reductase family protein [Rhodocytophaga aerolata]MDO1449406.1 TlpA disulfide reductase family protein [Rhodocytophaga aerolata]